MRYATAADMETYLGPEQFVLVAGDGGTPNIPRVRAAIERAEAEVDSYLSARYSMPLPGILSHDDPELNEVPEVLKYKVLELAVYYMAHTPGMLTEDRKVRYESAIKWLEKVACGKAEVIIERTGKRQKSPTQAQRVGPDRKFQREHTRGLV